MNSPGPANNPGPAPRQAGIVAFLAATTGAARSGVVATLAWQLATAGRAVLVVDWAEESRAVVDHLRPFRVGARECPPEVAGALRAVHRARGGGQATGLTRVEFPEAEGFVELFDVPVGAGADRLTVEHDPVADLRGKLATLGYDDVLVNVPQGAGTGVVALAATLSDIAVVCFPPGLREIADAAELAAAVQGKTPVHVDLIPVVTRFDSANESRRRAVWSGIRLAFGQSLGRGHTVADALVEIPYRSWEIHRPMLPALAEDPADGDLWDRYTRLSKAVTGANGPAPVPPSAALRDRYRRAFDLPVSSRPSRLIVAHRAEDRPWGDWVRARLEDVGAQTRDLRSAGDWLGADPADGLLVLVRGGDQDDPPGVDAALAARIPRHIREIIPATTARAEARDLRRRLLRHFALIDRDDGAGTGIAPVPGTTAHGVVSLPPRPGPFLGRGDDLDRLRDTFRAGEGRVVTVLTGADGIGKSATALEYAHRFGYDYSLVWWVPAHDRAAAHASLDDLSVRFPGERSDTGGSQRALDVLSREGPPGRFLLVYDDAVDLAAVADLLPDGDTGHILITTRDREAEGLRLRGMAEDEAVDLLRARLPGLTWERGREIAGLLGHVPLALDLAACLLAERAESSRLAREAMVDSARLAADQVMAAWAAAPAGPVVERMLSITMAALRETAPGRLAALLAQACAFLSPKGVSLGLLRSRPFLDRLLDAVPAAEAEPVRQDAAEIDRALWLGERHGLFRVDWGHNHQLRMNRRTQEVLRAAMSDGERAARQAATLAGLAGYAPTEVEISAPGAAERYDELAAHVATSGALESADPQVRRWLVNQTSRAAATRRPDVQRAALATGVALLADWADRFGAGDWLRVRLAGKVADLHRELGDPRAALRLTREALTSQLETREPGHPQVLIAARGRGADLRGLGVFTEARTEDEFTYLGFVRALGADHPQTLMAANNLALSLFLAGEPTSALERERDTYARRIRLFGPTDPQTVWSQAKVGFYLSELGDHNGATMLHGALQVLQQRGPRPDHTELTTQWRYGVALRRIGPERHRVARDRLATTLRDMRAELGPYHPETLACGLSHATALRLSGSDTGYAVKLARGALHGFTAEVALPSTHPFLALCGLGLGLALLAAGDTAGALTETATAAALLRERLGGLHPWTLAAELDNGLVLARSGDLGQAVKTTEAAHADALEFLGKDHPYTVAGAHNLRLAREGVDHGWKEIDVDVPRT
ncbi:FxSxx-COOH system tetratricopeptide repeat protein [Actinokineospora iranica]|uniref:Tetratricopeptide repeat-containing protein n=1 Tax=Actinokineospora iranica TaxID=1271860 RepID=A0A1G6WLR5_9PSEU|nr:FxSxx-COOH system tetratricopeptide repeat protein [Actinokineospora iranica]SDD66900.1 hypothetical protein SAMN05216174_11579 [Actinokineospora iranica]